MRTIFPLLFSLIFSPLFYCDCLAQSNANLSNNAAFDGEPYIAINPKNHQNIVAAWMGLKLSSGLYRVAIKTRVSLDGGKSFSAANALPHMGSGFGSADVSMAFDKNGLLYLCYIDYKQQPDSGGVFVARSHDGGLNWDSPSKVIDAYEGGNKRPLDRPWLVVDNSNTANSGTLYITTKPAPWIAPPNRNYYKASSDSGRTWTALANVDGGSHLVGNAIAAPMAAPATATNGNFCAIYPSYVSSQNVYPTFYLATSKNKGQTFSYTTVLAAVPSPLDTNYKAGYRLCTHPTDSEKMTFLTPVVAGGDVDIMAQRSNDGGQTWSARVRVNDDSLGNGKAQDMVWASYNEQGKLVVTWRDRRNANTLGFWDAGYDFYYAISSDNGQTFSANKKLTSQFVGFDSVLTANGNDFMSCVFYADTLYSVWGDTRTGKMNIFFTKTIVSSNTNVGVKLLNEDVSLWSTFPNPAHEMLTILATKEMLGEEVLLYDMNGKKLINDVIRQQEFSFPISKLAAGIYFLKIGNSIRRVVKE